MESEIGSEFNNWASWGSWSMCPNNEHAIAFVIRHQDNYDRSPGYDNTGLNSICLVCKISFKLVCSDKGPWGKWSSPFGHTSLYIPFLSPFGRIQEIRMGTGK